MDHEVRLAVSPDRLATVDSALGQLEIPASRMFEIRDALAVYLTENSDAEVFDLSQGDGGASLPGVPEALLEHACALQKRHGTAYTPPIGTMDFRRAVAEQYWQLRAPSGWGVENVIATQGGRDGLSKAYDAMQLLQGNRRGDCILVSAVPWISYKWGSYGAGANVLLAPGDPDSGWALTREGVEAGVAKARALGRRVAALVITSPDNPTGRSMPVAEQASLAMEAMEAGVSFVLFDWIYHQVTEGEPADVNALLAAIEPPMRDRCIVLDGLTKSLGASNIRSAHLLAGKEVVRVIKARASHSVIPSFFSQALAIAAYEEGRAAFASVVEPTNASRHVMRAWLAKRGIRHVIGDGYYAFIDVGQWLDKAEMKDSSVLSRTVAERFGVAAVPGAHFSEAGDRWFRLSYALPPEITQRALDRLWSGLEAL